MPEKTFREIKEEYDRLLNRATYAGQIARKVLDRYGSPLNRRYEKDSPTTEIRVEEMTCKQGDLVLRKRSEMPLKRLFRIPFTERHVMNGNYNFTSTSITVQDKWILVLRYEIPSSRWTWKVAEYQPGSWEEQLEEIYKKHFIKPGLQS